MKYVKNDIVECRNGYDYVIEKVDKVRNTYRAIPLTQYNSEYAMSGKLTDENIVRFKGRVYKGAIILGGVQ